MSSNFAAPVFVGAHEIGEHMFFFFRERAAETDQQVQFIGNWAALNIVVVVVVVSYQQVIYSRVARVCKVSVCLVEFQWFSWLVVHG